MTGIIILSLKKPAYSLAAFNLALSIKHFNPSINITLISDGEHKRHYRAEHYSVFDCIKEIMLCDYIDSNGLFQPGLAKLNVYKYSDYKHTLYFDSDSLVFQDIQPLLDKLKGSKFKSNIVDGYTNWTDPETFKSFFGFDFGLTINSSWFYFENKKIFEQANKYFQKGFDIEKIKPLWGKTLPDELFLNAALIKLKVDPKIDFDLMFFGNVISKKTFTEIETDFYAMTLYGGSRTVRDVYVTWYDRLCYKMCRAKGIEHIFKVHAILAGKHVNK